MGKAREIKPKQNEEKKHFPESSEEVFVIFFLHRLIFIR